MDGRTDVKLMLLINWIRGRFRRFEGQETRYGQAAGRSNGSDFSP